MIKVQAILSVFNGLEIKRYDVEHQTAKDIDAAKSFWREILAKAAVVSFETDSDEHFIIHAADVKEIEIVVLEENVAEDKDEET